MNHANGAVRASGTNAPAVPDRLLALTTEALAFVFRDRAEGMARQWLAGVPLSSSNEQSVLARSLALELALSVPSLKGTTAFDRLARAMKGRPPEDAAAVMLLRRSRLRYRGFSARGSKIWRPARHCPCCLLRPQTPWATTWYSAASRRPRIDTSLRRERWFRSMTARWRSHAVSCALAGGGSATQSGAPRPSIATSSATAHRRLIGAARLERGNPSFRSSQMAIPSML
jgi:hypothetical protein